MKRIIVSVAALAVGCMGLVGHAATGAGAAVAEFTIGLEITEGPPGSGPTTTTSVPADAQGRVCTFTITNNESSRPRPPDTITSDVTFSSDGRTLTLVNVERSNGAVTTGQLLVGATVTATITRGADPDPRGWWRLLGPGRGRCLSRADDADSFAVDGYQGRGRRSRGDSRRNGDSRPAAHWMIDVPEAATRRSGSWCPENPRALLPLESLTGWFVTTFVTGPRPRSSGDRASVS